MEKDNKPKKKSKIIKEIAYGKVDLECSLNVLKVLLYDLDKPKLLKWVDSELEGYKENADIPDYRYIKISNHEGYGGFLSKTFIDIDFDTLPDKLKKELSYHAVSEGVNSILLKIRNKKDLIIRYNITNSKDFLNEKELKYINVFFHYNLFQDVINSLKKRVFNILLELEKEYGCLDELCIDFKSDEKKKNKLYNYMINILYNNGNIQQNNSYDSSQINTANDSSTINAIQNNGLNIEELNRLIDNFLDSIKKEVDSNKEQEIIKENIQVISDQLKKNGSINKTIFENCYEKIYSIVNKIATPVSILTNLASVYNFVSNFIH